jgi:hypothetical protein
VVACKTAYFWNTLNLPTNSLLKKESDIDIAMARQYLSETEFNLAWADGEKMTIEEAFDLALKTLDEM